MNQRWRFLHLYTAHTRKPLLLTLYRRLLKDCIDFKTIDLPSGLWFLTEVKLQFRRSRNLDNMSEIIQAYQRGLEIQRRFNDSALGIIESQKEIIEEAYGQRGARKIDFVAAYCIEKNIDFGNIIEKYSHNIPIPVEYAEYMDQNSAKEELYEDLFEPHYDHKTLHKEVEQHSDSITWYKKMFLRRHQLISVQKALKEKRRGGRRRRGSR